MKSLNRIEKEDDKIHFQLNKRERSCTSTMHVSVNKLALENICNNKKNLRTTTYSDITMNLFIVLM